MLNFADYLNMKFIYRLGKFKEEIFLFSFSLFIFTLFDDVVFGADSAVYYIGAENLYENKGYYTFGLPIYFPMGYFLLILPFFCVYTIPRYKHKKLNEGNIMQVSNINNRPNQFLITINSLNYNLIKLDNYYIPDFYIVDMFQSYKSLIAIRGFELRKITSIPNEYPTFDEGDDNLNELMKQGILYNFDDGRLTITYFHRLTAMTLDTDIELGTKTV